MVVASASCSHVGFWPSMQPQCRGPPTSIPAGPSSLWSCRRLRTPISISRAAYSLDPHGVDESVDVIGIGSRKDSVIDFCLASPAVSASRFRFWTIYSRDQKKIQLLERCHSKDVVIRNVEIPLAPHSCQPATILVASAGHDLDHLAAVDLLCGVKSAGGLAIAIVLKPFSFEGKRRQKEVNDLVNKLKSCSNFHVVVGADSFFTAEAGTLAEALKSANITVLQALSTISSMISKMHLHFFSATENTIKDIKSSKVLKVMESYGELKIYYGAGYSVNASIKQAIFHCPLFDAGLKDFNGLAIMTLTSSCNVGENDVQQIIHSFRQITGYTRDAIFSKMFEPNLEPKLVVITLLIMGSHNDQLGTQNKGLFSGLLQNLPFFFRFFHVDPTKTCGTSTSSNNSLSDTFLSSASGNMPVLNLTNVANPLELIPNQDAFSDMPENEILRNTYCHETSEEAAELAETSHTSMNQDIVTVMHNSRYVGPAFHTAQLWAKECSVNISNRNDKEDTFCLLVGVKSTELYPDYTPHSNCMLDENLAYFNQDISGCIAADVPKKDSLLSVRAAMMLETERKSLKSWNPVLEIQYRGGIYRGRCQGGLPEGKGRLTSTDGSFYEGFWKCGKRSGLGTFYYSNGDLFRGQWRDDLMHGKGWLYFHTGDRWFANFWRGKANGEGRFFSKNGSVFFGCFRDGWRHGKCVCIDSDGSRWTELWDDGVLVNRTPLDKDANI